MLTIIFPDLPYINAHVKVGLEKLSIRRERLCIKTFNDTIEVSRLLVRKFVDERNVKTRDTHRCTKRLLTFFT